MTCLLVGFFMYVIGAIVGIVIAAMLSVGGRSDGF